MPADRFTFDRDAPVFDERAGLPAAAARAVAAAVLELARPGPGDVVVDLGAGTGEVGVELVASGLRYVGLDLSLAMLARFRRKLAAGEGSAFLAAADGEGTWPIRDARAAVLFSSRTVHLLATRWVAAEVLRVVRPGGLAVFGRVRRSPESVRSALRREMRRLLGRHGVEGRSGAGGRDRLVGLLEERGAAVAERIDAARWPVEERPADSLAAWRAKDGLAGRPLAEEIRRDVLERLESYARERYDDLTKIHPAEELYELVAVRLPG